jgi:hypothetical protein
MASTQRTPLGGPSQIVKAVNPRIGAASSIGVLQGINLGSLQGCLSSATFMCMKTMAVRENVEGTPGPPCLALIGPTMTHFRWSLHTGQNVLTIQCKQAINGSPRPSVVVKANPSCGVNADVTSSAASGTGWVTITVTVTATCTTTTDNAVIVELWNNYVASYQTAYFDNISTT